MTGLVLLGIVRHPCRYRYVVQPREAFVQEDLYFCCGTCGRNDFCLDICGMCSRMLYILLVCDGHCNDHMAFCCVVYPFLCSEAGFSTAVSLSGVFCWCAELLLLRMRYSDFLFEFLLRKSRSLIPLLSIPHTILSLIRLS